MGKLNKEDFLHPVNRDGGTEKVLPIEVELEDKSGTVMMTPLTMPELTGFMEKGGSWLKSTEGLEFNTELLSRHLIEPKISKEELMSIGMKIGKLPVLLKALQKISGFFTESQK
jgi:hypothetical protein